MRATQNFSGITSDSQIKKESKMLKKKIPYNFKKGLLMAMIGGMAFQSCKKDEEPIVQHDTTYSFSSRNYDNLENLNRVRASADSAQVRNIIFQVIPNNDGEEFWGVTIANPVNNAIKPAFEAANGKGKGKGTFLNVREVKLDAETAAWLNAQGYSIEFYKESATKIK
ncbi:MAG: hypothetical protein LBC98_02770 [Prevotellaceae bacterium]|jgi:hypothetical protein|nr:hypothetical protein [Prevotellaceae bacterium]